MNRRTLFFAVLVLASACGPKSDRGTTSVRDASAAAIADDAAYAEQARAFQALPIGDASRDAKRQRLLAYLGAHAGTGHTSEEYDVLVARVQAAVSLYLPDELARHALPGAMDSAVAALHEAASQRGEEGTALGALDLRAAMHPDDAALREQHERISAFSRESRQALDSPIEREDSLLDVFVAEAEICPSTSVLDKTAAQLEVRRDSLFGGGNPRAARAVEQLLVETPLEVAGLFLARQDLENALRRVRVMGNSGSAPAVVSILESALANDEESVHALWELVQAYAPRRPEVAMGICYRGRRDHPSDPRFPLCLARISGALDRHADATAFFAEAIADDPDERQLYDEALGQLGELIAEGVFDSDPANARALATRAEGILAERNRRFPDSASQVPIEQFQFLFGMLEMNSGNLDAAEAHFQASVAARPTAVTLRQWGLLLERKGQPAEALRKYRAALDLTPQDDVESALHRAELLEEMGDALRASGDAEQSKRMYRQALEPWDAARSSIEDERLAFVEARRGVLLDRTDRRDASADAFRAAIAGSAEREVYATVLSYLVTAEPNAPLALETYASALHQGTLDTEWKVYFGLWTRLAVARANAPAPTQVDEALRPFAEGATWSAKLARFGIGGMSYAQLLAAASSRGEQCEAHFYEGARLLATGDRAGAKQRFQDALDTKMVSFFEYAMAQELMKTLP